MVCPSFQNIAAAFETFGVDAGHETVLKIGRKYNSVHSGILCSLNRNKYVGQHPCASSSNTTGDFRTGCWIVNQICSKIIVWMAFLQGKTGNGWHYAWPKTMSELVMLKRT